MALCIRCIACRISNGPFGMCHTVQGCGDRQSWLALSHTTGGCRLHATCRYSLLSAIVWRHAPQFHPAYIALQAILLNPKKLANSIKDGAQKFCNRILLALFGRGRASMLEVIGGPRLHLPLAVPALHACMPVHAGMINYGSSRGFGPRALLACLRVLQEIALMAVGEGKFLAWVPLAGSVLFAATLRGTRKRMGQAVQQLAVAAHRRWIMENIEMPHARYYKR